MRFNKQVVPIPNRYNKHVLIRSTDYIEIAYLGAESASKKTQNDIFVLIVRTNGQPDFFGIKRSLL